MTKETENWVEFGFWVKRKREAKGWTQEELANRVGFSDRQTIYRIEAGTSTKRSSVIKIAKALDESPTEVIAIAFGVPKSPESAADLAERKAEIARTAELIDNWKEMSSDEQARALAVIRLFKGEPREGYEIQRSSTEATDQEAERPTLQSAPTRPPRTPSVTTRSSTMKPDRIDRLIDSALLKGGGTLSEHDRAIIRKDYEQDKEDDQGSQNSE